MAFVCSLVMRRLMATWLLRWLAPVALLVGGISAHAQSPDPLVPTEVASSTDPQATLPGQDAGPESTASGLFDRLRSPFSQKDDPEGAINTDRPTFTPSHTTIPKGRLQIESGFTFTTLQGSGTRANLYDLPELAARFGLTDWLEFRTFWLGQTIAQSRSAFGGHSPFSGGLSDMEVGFKWQLVKEAEEKWYIPRTALITSIFAPTGGASLLSSQTVQPYINLIYGWNPTKKLLICGSTGYLGMRQQATPGSGLKADSFERFHQSLFASYAATKRTTVYYEWYAFTFTNSADNRPQNYMDSGVLYLLTPNMQLDLRAGFGLSGRPDDFFSGAGFSVRF